MQSAPIAKDDQGEEDETPKHTPLLLAPHERGENRLAPFALALRGARSLSPCPDSLTHQE